jgi:WD40 repeat protein
MGDTAADIKNIFVEALERVSDDERAAYLEQACGGSPAVRARVEALLGAISRAGSFLEAPAVNPDDGGKRASTGLSTLAVEAAAGETPAAFLEPSAPTRLGDFELIRRLGAGSMGVVFEAWQISLNRPVALKVIRTGLVAGEAELRRFRIEAEAVARLDHPRIVPIYGLGEHEDCHFFSMKLVRGGSLQRLLPTCLADPRTAARLVAEVARAMQHAHDRGILHRDLKPSNILLDEEGQPLVTDFGLAKRSDDESSLTLSGTIVGTPSYMAPEQASGQNVAVTAVTDVYGLGAVLYALLTGRAPFVADTILKTIEQVCGDSPVPPSRINPRVGRDLETICLRCLEKDPWRRYASANALAQDLQRWLDGAPIVARPVGAAARVWMWSRRNPMVTGLLAALVLFALVTTWQWWRAEGLLRQARREASGEAIDHALSICAQGDVGRGMLRLAEALETIPSEADDLKRAVRANLMAWSRHETRLMNVMRHTDVVHFVAFSPDGRTVLTASADGTARLWDAFTGDPRGTPLRHAGSVMHAAFSPDSEQVITASLDWTARLWDVDGGRPTGAPLRHPGPVRSVAFSPDGRTVLTGCSDGTARIWNAASQQPLGEPLHQKGWIQQVGFRPDGNVAITAGQGDGAVGLWDLRSGQVIGQAIPYYPGRRHNVPPQFFACSADGAAILTTGRWRSGQQECAQVWDATSGRPLGAPLCHDGAIRTVGLSCDGKVAVTGGDDRTARLWNASTGHSLCDPLRHEGQVLAVALDAEGRRVLTGSEDRTARVWKVPSGEPIGDPLHHPGPVRAVAFRPDGRTVVTGCDDGAARLWALAPAEPAGSPVPDGDLKALSHLARSPDGGTILMGHNDGSARVRDAATMQPLGPALRHEYAILSVAISPDSTRLLTGSVDGTVQVWSARTRQLIGRPLYHRGPVHSVAFSPDGRMALSGSADHTARLWDVATGKPIGMPLPHNDSVVAVAFSIAGDAALTKSEKGIVRRWDLAADASGTDERFALSAQVAIGAEIDAYGTIRALAVSAWNQKRNRLRTLGGVPQP